MKLSTIVLGTLATFATASVIRSPQPNPEPQGLAGIQNVVGAIAIPGWDSIQAVLKTLKEDTTWKADYSDKEYGNVIFTNVGEKTCTLVQMSWGEYGKYWGKLVHAGFNTPCNGGYLSEMEEKQIDILRMVIGEGH